MIRFRELRGLYIIAEIGCNHNGDIDLARRMIRAAKDCGAHAVKFQLFDSTNLVTGAYLDDLDSGKVKLENVDAWRSPELNLLDVRSQLKAFTLSKVELADVRRFAREVGIDFGCTPVDPEGVDFLKEIDADFVKIASMDVNNPLMVDAAARSGLPLVVSTGMSDLAEIDRAYRWLCVAGCHNFALLHCVSIYPPRDEIVNLRFMRTLQEFYDCEVGYSDHTLGFSVTLAAIALGARVIEKHFTLDKNMPGWDHKVSADGPDLRIICEEGVRIARALGARYKWLSPEETEKRETFRRSVTTRRSLRAGETIEIGDVTFKRPGNGISPDLIESVLGRNARADIPADTTLTFDHLV